MMMRGLMSTSSRHREQQTAHSAILALTRKTLPDDRS